MSRNNFKAQSSPSTQTSNSKMALSHDQHFLATDGIYRSFVRACKTSIAKEDASLGPTVGQFIGSLMGLKKECKLHDSWRQFALRFPEHALLLRRSAREFRGPNGFKFQIELPKGAKTMTKRLTISNPDYDGGMPQMAGTTPKQGSILGKLQKKRMPRDKASIQPNKSRKLCNLMEQKDLSREESSEYETADEMNGESVSEEYIGEGNSSKKNISYNSVTNSSSSKEGFRKDTTGTK